jgi:hypothetical protein
VLESGAIRSSLAVAGHGRAADGAGGVLGAHHVCRHCGRGGERPQGAQDVDLGVTHAVGAEVDGWFHRDEAEQLQEVVLDHVAERAGTVIVAAATAFHAQVLGAGDLHMVDVAVVPERLENGVGEAQDHDVLGGFLAQVVIDAVGGGFVEGQGQSVVEGAGAGEVGAEGLFDDDARPAGVAARPVEPGGAQAVEDIAESLGRGGQVEEAVAAAATGRLDRMQPPGQRMVILGIVEIAAVVVDIAGEGFPLAFVVALARDLAVHGGQFGAECGFVLVAPGEAEDRGTWRPFPVGGDVVECRHQLAVGQIAGGTEDHDGTWRGPLAGDEVFAKGVHKVNSTCIHAARIRMSEMVNPEKPARAWKSDRGRHRRSNQAPGQISQIHSV